MGSCHLHVTFLSIFVHIHEICMHIQRERNRSLPLTHLFYLLLSHQEHVSVPVKLSGYKMKKHTSPLLQESMFTCVLGILSDFLITLSKLANTAAKVNVAVMKDRVIFSKPHFYLVLWWTPDKRFFPVFPHTDTLCFLIMNHTSFHFLKEIHKQRSCARII